MAVTFDTVLTANVIAPILPSEAFETSGESTSFNCENVSSKIVEK